MRTRLIPQLIALVILSLAAAAPAQQGATAAEQSLFKSTNRHRLAHHLLPLSWNADLAQAAHNHALVIVQNPSPARHQYPGEPNLKTRADQTGAHFGTISENVAGNGTTAAEIDKAWMASPVHRANILDPHLNAVGIAVAEDHGYLYAVEDFAMSVPTLSRGEVEDRVSRLLRARGIKSTTSRDSLEDARQSCESDSSVSRVSATVMQWDGPDLTQLPDAVLQQVPVDKIYAVAVASCPTERPAEGFTTFHVAVLIFRR